MHPYRDAPPPGEPSSAPPGEELVVYLAMLGIGALPLGGTLLGGGVFGVEATIGLLMMVGGSLGLVSVRRARR